MPSATSEKPIGDDHGGSPNGTEVHMANGEPPDPPKKDVSEETDKDEKKPIPRIRASKLEYKTVNQMYSPDTLPYG
jgi:hypothetical protein